MTVPDELPPAATDAAASRDGRVAGVRAWTFWTLDRRAKRYLAFIEVLAGALVCFGLSTRMPDLRLGIRFVVVLALGLVYTELASRLERFKRYLGAGKVLSNQTSVWAFAAAVLLPAGYAGLLVVGIYVHLLAQRRGNQPGRIHRAVFSAATMVLATVAAAYLIGIIETSRRLANTAPTALAVAAGVVIFPVVNLVTLLAGMYLVTRPRRLRDVFPSRDEMGFELITIVLGVVTAEFVAHAIWLTPVVLALVATSHRSSLVKDLRAAAITDPKTGLLNAAAWRDRARQGRSLADREHEAVAVLVVDLDHFKVVNDTHGHLVGDQVLALVAGALRDELRDHDSVGRFGGEEFVVFLYGAALPAALSVAERLRIRIAATTGAAATTVTASIGVAVVRAGSQSLEQLVEAADRMLYVAKAAGRDRVRGIDLTASVSSAASAVWPAGAGTALRY
jgi:diguanylate cyclase (GGDEF)-like protein